ncbi:MAG: phosphocholine cytidylyltransferase family protein [Myxococcota bacterium]|jgi:L-glutamine-phosphate cytidylyltransferase|nr:phosphocholine cytidylyltransferase family protein [Myxococcota bacterium]
MTDRPKAAVILAAGMGTRLKNVFSDRPKGFVEIGGEGLIHRSVRLLQERGIERIVIVSGHMGSAYEALAAELPGLEVVENAEFATTGSMASLARALEAVNEDFLLLESDLFYEERALDVLLEDEAPDILLASGPTGATDEVWIEASSGCLQSMSKDPAELGEVYGELVGIVRISHALAREMVRAYERFVEENGHGQMAYETDALVEAAGQRPVALRLVPDLLWGEVDYEHHYLRVRDEVWPRWASGRAADHSS